MARLSDRGANQKPKEQKINEITTIDQPWVYLTNVIQYVKNKVSLLPGGGTWGLKKGYQKSRKICCQLDQKWSQVLLCWVEYACLMRKVQGSTPGGCLLTFYDLFFSHHFWHFFEFWIDFHYGGLPLIIRDRFRITGYRSNELLTLLVGSVPGPQATETGGRTEFDQ